jgi:hypothetical protein
MILRGILDNSLGQLCIRGFAYLKDLEKASVADFLFQRNLIEKQDYVIRNFLENNPNLFFPEVILSCKVPGNQTGRGISIDPLADLQTGKNFTVPDLGISFKSKNVSFRGVVDSRQQDNTRIVTIEIDEGKLIELAKDDKQPFLRIDGNHRLSAAKAFKGRQTIEELITPFCIILLSGITPSLYHNSEKFERIVFHNINSKSVPLTDEEIYRVILDAPTYFDDKELSTSKDFGSDYLFARWLLPKLQDRLDDFPAIADILSNKKSKVETFRSVLVDFFRLLLHYEHINKKFTQKELVYRTLQKVEIFYHDNPVLKETKSHGLLVAFMFFIFRNNAFNLEWFKNWVIDNHIYELEKVSPYDLVAIFKKILLSKERTVFISMAFGKPYTERHFKFIKNLINELNDEKKANIKIFPLRIDRFKDGSAYKIPDKILDKIEESGLLIADLTHMNPNVYHEVGYLMGLNKALNKNKLNLLMICNTSKTAIPGDIGFNIRNHKIIGFEDTDDLKEPLKEELYKHYFL